MKKRILSLLMVYALLLLTACGGHTHSAEGGWTGDLETHWHECGECGETFDAAAHTLEEGVCTGCGSETATYEDGTAMLVCYNEYGDLSRLVYYAADGSVESEDRVEYVYDEDGNKLSQKSYSGEVLSSEYEYARASSGELYVSKDTYYYEDGSKDCGEYDENGNSLRNTSYTADGAVAYSYEYEYSEEAGWMREKVYEGDRLTSEQEFLMDQEGNQITIRHVYYNEDQTSSVTEYDEYGNETLEAYYDADGKLESAVRYENEYDSNGSRILRRIYEGDRLIEEVEYFVGSDEEGSWSMSGKTTVYHEDGTKMISDRDLELTWATETTYDADGGVIEEVRYEYEYDEEGESIGAKGYRNGKLFQESHSIRNADGEATGIRMISYDEDGTKTVSEYNEAFDLVKETVYDADGNVISESE